LTPYMIAHLQQTANIPLWVWFIFILLLIHCKFTMLSMLHPCGLLSNARDSISHRALVFIFYLLHKLTQPVLMLFNSLRSNTDFIGLSSLALHFIQKSQDIYYSSLPSGIPVSCTGADLHNLALPATFCTFGKISKTCTVPKNISEFW